MKVFVNSKFKVVINWKGEFHSHYTHAPSKLKALHNSITALAMKLDLTPSYVRNYVLADGKDRYYIL